MLWCWRTAREAEVREIVDVIARPEPQIDADCQASPGKRVDPVQQAELPATVRQIRSTRLTFTTQPAAGSRAVIRGSP